MRCVSADGQQADRVRLVDYSVYKQLKVRGLLHNGVDENEGLLKEWMVRTTVPQARQVRYAGLYQH
jgi:hypothetical protein